MKSNKTSAWAILDLDQAIARQQDKVGIKAIFQSEEAAVRAIEELRSRETDASYVLRQTRLFLSDPDTLAIEMEKTRRIQGLLPAPIATGSSKQDLPELVSIRNLWFELPVHSRRAILLPLIGYYMEQAVARALNGSSIVDRERNSADIALATGELVEVKTTILDDQRRRAPSVSFHSLAGFQYLALVVCDASLNVRFARLFPTDLIMSRVRAPARVRDDIRSTITLTLRITEDLLHHPAAKDIHLNIPT